jgi:similar to stage IV sporulation protein
MLLKILRFLFGYVKVEIYGYAPERFMNLLIYHEIIVWDVEYSQQGYRFYTGRRNLMNMKPYLAKTNMKVKILEKKGLPFILKRYKKRFMFLAGFILAGMILFVLSLFVWEIKVVGEDNLVAENVIKQIEENYVALGTMKSSVNCSELEENLRKDFDEISWVSCELKGTVLTVYLEEGIAPAKTEQEETAGDVVALKDGVITKMITRSGTPVVKVEDSVKKGDILISGTIYIYDDNNEVLETNYIAADGDVYGTTTYSYEDYVELQYYEKNYDEKSKKQLTLFFMNYCITPYVPKMNTEDYDTYTEIHKAKIFDDFYLPFGYKVIERTSYQLEKKERTKKEGEKMLNERLKKKINNFKEKGVEIIKNDVTIREADGKLVAEGILTLNESIAKFKKASKQQE